MGGIEWKGREQWWESGFGYEAEKRSIEGQRKAWKTFGVLKRPCMQVSVQECD